MFAESLGWVDPELDDEEDWSPSVADATEEDQPLLGHLLTTASKIAKQEGFGKAFRLVVNNGEDAGQAVFHLHIHLLAGRSFGWPPG